MKNNLIVLAIAALFLGSCGQAGRDRKLLEALQLAAKDSMDATAPAMTDIQLVAVKELTQQQILQIVAREGAYTRELLQEVAAYDKYNMDALQTKIEKLPISTATPNADSITRLYALWGR